MNILKRNGLGKKFMKSLVEGDPKTCSDMVNKFGTYNVQATNDTDNDFPKIEQH